MKTWNAIVAAAVPFVFGVGASAVPASAAPPAGPGLQLMNQRCASCHPLTQIFAAPRKTPIEWTRVVRKMASKGVEMTPEEMKTISEYLGKNFAANK